MFRAIDRIIEQRLSRQDEVSKSGILEEFRRQPEILRVFHEHGLSTTDDLDGRDTSRNMVDWFDSRYSRWKEHEKYFSKLIRTERGGEFLYSLRANRHGSS